jgi:transposase
MLGVDVSKDTLVTSLLDPTTRRALWQQDCPNTLSGVRSLLRRTPAQVPLVLEPTGRYGQLVAQEARAAGRQVLLAEPRRAKAFLRSIQSRAKTDRLDSTGLALFALSQPLPAYPLKSAAAEELDQLLSARKGIAAALARLEQQAKELPYAQEMLRAAIQSLREQRDRLDKKIEQLPRGKEGTDSSLAAAAQVLCKVPGIGPVTAAALASRLCSRAFCHSDQFVAYIGLDIRVIQSGRKKGQRGLTKQGDAELRRLLFNCARAATLAKGSPFREHYERERAKGLSRTAAHCAVARKLARLSWSLVRHGGTYDPERVYTRAEKKPENGSAPAVGGFAQDRHPDT